MTTNTTATNTIVLRTWGSWQDLVNLVKMNVNSYGGTKMIAGVDLVLNPNNEGIAIVSTIASPGPVHGLLDCDVWIAGGSWDDFASNVVSPAVKTVLCHPDRILACNPSICLRNTEGRETVCAVWYYHARERIQCFSHSDIAVTTHVHRCGSWAEVEQNVQQTVIANGGTQNIAGISVCLNGPTYVGLVTTASSAVNQAIGRPLQCRRATAGGSWNQFASCQITPNVASVSSTGGMIVAFNVEIADSTGQQSTFFLWFT